ncbi:hypothetical protein Y88_2197 [Novosphingobium nitrogenifigens DSM 19370]|uniref:Uncharacterized protein n=1 Tax=Novosphingobium nitrogenifigens DSM 19370 TaxID=983920 RepID=F1Z5E3_9SPHN|nr:hypothetical protein Y88_2197 [Novosphingobium nitrogenifigens DSM 19370]
MYVHAKFPAECVWEERTAGPAGRTGIGEAVNPSAEVRASRARQGSGRAAVRITRAFGIGICLAMRASDIAISLRPLSPRKTRTNARTSCGRPYCGNPLWCQLCVYDPVLKHTISRLGRTLLPHCTLRFSCREPRAHTNE